MATKANFQVTLARRAPGRDYGVWAGKSGGEVTRDTSDYYPGAMRPARKNSGTPTTSDLTIRKAVEDLTDEDLRQLFEVDVTSDTSTATHTCVVQRLSAADRVVGAPRSYACCVTGISESETDAGSADAAELTLTLSVFGLPTVAS